MATADRLEPLGASVSHEFPASRLTARPPWPKRAKTGEPGRTAIAETHSARRPASSHPSPDGVDRKTPAEVPAQVIPSAAFKS